MLPTPSLHGYVAHGFTTIQDTLLQELQQPGALGAAICVYKEGKKVVDLWGGFKDLKRQEPWQQDTLVYIFSATKGIAALTYAHAHSLGWFSYNDPVAYYWPAFGAKKKEHITIRQLLNHEAGLSTVDETLSFDLLSHPDALGRILAAQTPEWLPGTKRGYHALTLGLYMNELFRRIDPKHRSLCGFFNEDIAQPYKLEIFLVSRSAEIARLAAMTQPKRFRYLLHPQEVPWSFLLAYTLGPLTLAGRAFLNTSFAKRPLDLVDDMYMTLELPSTNGVVTVRDLAKLYALSLNPSFIKPHTLAELSTPFAHHPPMPRKDAVLKRASAYHLGLNKPFEGFPFGPPHAYGAVGLSGAFAFADPSRGIAYAYAPNSLGVHFWNDPRDQRLRQAMNASLHRLDVS